MCLIVVKKENSKIPEKEFLKNGFEKNSHGVGIAYLKENENKIKIKKDFVNFKSFYDFMHENIEEKDILIVHFRFGTQGFLDEGNRHPFPLSNNENKLRATEIETNIIMAHNGVISQFLNKGEKLSDTQLFIKNILSEPLIKDNINNKVVKDLLLNYIGTDRMVILKDNKDVILFGNFELEKEDNCYYSNLGYKNKIITIKPNNFWGLGKENNSFNNSYSFSKFLSSKKSTCDFCGKKTFVTWTPYNKEYYELCKKCRKKARKNKLIIPKNKTLGFLNDTTKEEKEEKEEWKCSYCNKIFKHSKLILTWGQYLVCHKCYNEILSTGLVKK